MDDEEFGNIIKKAVEGIPSEFRDKMENVTIISADYPTEEQLQVSMHGRHGLLFGLYQGIPKTRRGNYGVGPTLPDKITIFKIPILRISRNFDEAVKNIRRTVIHEIAHHFGMSDKDIERAKPEETN